MGLFDGFIPNKEDKKMKDAEKRQQDNALEASTYEAANDVNSEMMLQQEAKMDLLRWQQDMTEDEKSLYIHLLDLIEVEGKLIPRPNGKPLCNDRFISEVVRPIIRPFLSKNMINTTYDREGVRRMLRNTFDTLTDTLADGYNDNIEEGYGIEFRNYDIIDRELKNFCESAANRSLGGFTKKHDSSIIKVVEGRTHIDRQEENKRGIFGFSS